LHSYLRLIAAGSEDTEAIYALCKTIATASLDAYVLWLQYKILLTDL